MPLALVDSLDVGAVRLLAGAVGRYPLLDRLMALAAHHVAKVYVAALGFLFLGGPGEPGRRLAVRIAAALGLTIAAVGAIGGPVGRTRPFARHDDVAALVEHAPHRSFPSRHVACAATMATVALPTAPTVATLLGALSGLLAVSRVYT
ncbi:MAG: phosphatase PAP2 family protein, partial [Chloroflexota bacterium]|nr:phosphatase PAP2 family protein [Chloroflexota bacterium]